MNKIITCTGYGGTGSSVLLDILSEFQGYVCFRDLELWFLQDFFGVSDLEYYLCDCGHRSKVYFVLDKFKKYCEVHNDVYSSVLNVDFYEISQEFIKSLDPIEFKKCATPKDFKFPLLFEFIFKIIVFIQRTLSVPSGVDYREPWLPKIKHEYINLKNDQFHKLVREYTKKILCSNLKDGEIGVFDQLVPAQNPSRYLSYVDNMYIVVVDRDPRELYYMNKYVWKGAPYMCDTSKVDEFCDWYRAIRSNNDKSIHSPHVLHLNFEDFVLKFDETIERFREFCSIRDLVRVKSNVHFDLNKSSQYINKWDGMSDISREIDFIEKSLPEYLYKF